MSACPLGICDGSGWIDDEAERLVRPCRCRPQLVAGRRARALSATIPQRYREVSFDRPPLNDMPEALTGFVRRYLRDLDNNLRSGRGLWFVGDVGTGKTALAMLVSREALAGGKTVAIYSVPRLLTEIRGTYGDEQHGAYADFIDRLTRVDLLHLDDLGAERSNPWVLEQLYTVINIRYEEEKAVLVTANAGNTGGEDAKHDVHEIVRGLGAQLGARTVSRLEEMCTLLPVFGRDRRRELRVLDRRSLADASEPGSDDPRGASAASGLHLAPDPPAPFDR